MPRSRQRNYGLLIALATYLWRYPKLRIPIIIIAALVVAVLLVHGCMQKLSPPPSPPITRPDGRGTEREGEPPIAPADPCIHLLMGNPSGATEDAANADNYLMRKPYFALSYNNTKGTPNWVSWCVQRSDLGNAPRSPQFYPDKDLNGLKGFRQVSTFDYNGSGFDRGHMCPHGDRAGTPQSAEATFVMTNIIPQSPPCNQKAWADLEDYCRELVRRKDQTLYTVAGPEGRGGEGKAGPKESIGRAEVTVPARCWKVILALNNGKGDAEDVKRVSRDTRVIAVVMPNDMTVGHGWAKYRTSVKEVEKLTGFNFFDRVPAAVIGSLKERVDDVHISAGQRRRGDD
jgi:endonuclease G